MELVQEILTQNPCYKAGRKIKVKGLMLHSVGCPQQSAKVFIKQWNNSSSGRACVHAFIDGNTGIVYQTLPWNYRGWHAGGSANNTHIGVEMCEPSCISYTMGASFHCYDRGAALLVVKRTYASAVALFSMLSKQFGLNPLGDGVIIGHKEGNRRGVASAHADPDHLWNGLDTGFTMEGFRRDVAAAIKTDNQNVYITSLAVEKQNDSTVVKLTNYDNNSSNKICAGDKVRIIQGAVYYNDKSIPDWVMKDVWIVKSVSANKVVIDQNVGNTHAICSLVDIKYLRKA